jgi:hypothetical protein
MTTKGRANPGQQSPKGRPNLPRGPTSFQAEVEGRGRDFPEKLARRAGSIGLAVVPLTLSGSAVAAAATVRSWPAVAALSIVLVCSLVWVALGPTVSSLEIHLSDGMIVRQHQLTFARRAPLPALWLKQRGSLEPRNAPNSSVALTTLQVPNPVPSTAEIRAWAIQQGRTVGRHGPLPADVRRDWQKAHIGRSGGCAGGHDEPPQLSRQRPAAGQVQAVNALEATQAVSTAKRSDIEAGGRRRRGKPDADGRACEFRTEDDQPGSRHSATR